MKFATFFNVALLATALLAGFTNAAGLRQEPSLRARDLQSVEQLSQEIESKELRFISLQNRRNRRARRGRSTVRLDRRIVALQAKIDELEDELDAAEGPVPAPAPVPAPGPAPGPAPVTGLLTVADLDLDSIASAALTPQGEERVNQRALSIAGNTPAGGVEGRYRNAGNGNFIRLTRFNQGTQIADRETAPSTLVENLVVSFGRDLGLPGDSQFRAIVEQFRPLAVSAVNSLIAITNAESDLPDIPTV